ncbi:MAG: hypothetical protein CTY31_09395 [Hyphomicrobium sp.]|nr:MAG: hypothetical protein CTY31_09395 [Hyphomicrobium sp.]
MRVKRMGGRRPALPDARATASSVKVGTEFCMISEIIFAPDVMRNSALVANERPCSENKQNCALL